MKYIITYSRMGTKQVPDKWAFGMVVSYKTIPQKYDGYCEIIDNKNDAIKRGKLLMVVQKITESRPKYCDIHIFEGDDTKIEELRYANLEQLKQELTEIYL